MTTHKKMVLLGYSGHAYVVADAVLRQGGTLLGYLNSSSCDSNPFQIDYLGSENDVHLLSELHKTSVELLVAIGDNQIRERLQKYLCEHHLKLGTVIHPSATVGFGTRLGAGTVVLGGAVVNSLASVGEGCIINTNATVEHECCLGDFVHIAPGVVLAGNVTVGRGSFIGANAVVKQGVKIGQNVIIGAGSVVLYDVADGTKMAGNPLRRI